MKFEVKKFVNQVAIVPDDKREWIKWGVALVIAIFARFSIELGEAETILITGLVKAGADYGHFLLKEKGVV